MSLHDATVSQMSKMLRNLQSWLDKAASHAEAKSFDPEVLLAARLAPDQFPLLRQVQSTCDAAKAVAARLGGVEVPSHPDEEKTLPELRERIAKTLAFLETIRPEAVEASADREIKLPFMPDKTIKGAHYAVDFAIPNFYFHLCHAYALLRHNGVDLGKRDYIGTGRFIG